MKKIYEHNGNKYELVKKESDSLCGGCAFNEADDDESTCLVRDNEDMDCTTPFHGLLSIDYIFKQITEPNETNQKEL
jgi:hypothetical protein